MKEKTIMFILNILKNIINVYFDTFFVLYFLEVANYEVIPLVKYYLILYLFGFIGFYLGRKGIKKNILVPYFRVGISLQALYIALIMILKEDMINYYYFIAIIKGIADGFFHFPKNILETEKITNEERQKYSGLINIFHKISAIIIPLLLGVLLTHISYPKLSQIFFYLFVIMFILSFYLKDNNYVNGSFDLQAFKIKFKDNCYLKYALIIPLMAGFTYLSGVMATIVTLLKINSFKTNLNLGIVDSICGGLFLLASFYYTSKLKKKDFKLVAKISGVVSFISLGLLAIYPSLTSLIIYLLVRNSFIGLINLISNNVINDLSNIEELKKGFKAEFYFMREFMLTIARCFGYLLLLIISLGFGLNYINYLLIIAGISLLIESIMIGYLVNKI